MTWRNSSISLGRIVCPTPREPATLVNRLPKNATPFAATGTMPDYPLLTANTPSLRIAVLTDIAT